MISAYGKQTINSIQEAMKQGQRTPLLAAATLLDALANKGDQVSLAELAEMLKCDTAMIVRVLSRANLVAHAPGLSRVDTLNRALHVLGVERLRSLVVSGVLTESAQTVNAVQREMSIFALSSGLIAQTMARDCGGDPEQAFLCGALRHFGELMLATLFPEKIIEARKPGSSIQKVFGVDLGELTTTLLADANLPEVLMVAISRPDTAGAQVSSMASYSLGGAALTSVLFNSDVPPAVFRHEAHQILARYAPEAVIKSTDDLDKFLHRQRRSFEDFARQGGFLSVAKQPITAIKMRVKDHPLPRPPNSPRAVYEGWSAAASRHGHLARYPLGPGSTRRIAPVFNAQHVLLFNEQCGGFELTDGHGPWAQKMKGPALFASGDKNLFGLCASVRQPMLIHNAKEPNMATHLPSWMPFGQAPASFYLLPLGEGDTAQILLVGWDSPRRIKPPVAREVIAAARERGPSA